MADVAYLLLKLLKVVHVRHNRRWWSIRLAPAFSKVEVHVLHKRIALHWEHTQRSIVSPMPPMIVQATNIISYSMELFTGREHVLEKRIVLVRLHRQLDLRIEVVWQTEA
jgi:hypothetical protein